MTPQVNFSSLIRLKFFEKAFSIFICNDVTLPFCEQYYSFVAEKTEIDFRVTCFSFKFTDH